MILGDEELRAILGPEGLLEKGAVSAPPLEEAFVVFAQRPDARVDVDAWSAHAQRFFATRIGLTIEKRYAGGPPLLVDAARFVVAPDAAPAGVRFAFARPRDEQDLARAEAADTGGGLALLARRCATVWLVVRDEEFDALALRLAAILASVLLGPILDVRTPELFGAKTARSKLQALPRR